MWADVNGKFKLPVYIVCASLSLRLRFFIYQIFNYPINFLKHLVPLNSPKFLIHFIKFLHQLFKHMFFQFY
ncbi:hypothetical protein E2986_11217 [Frieseomelitta varia]|uniref:Uncharacterized protein n=1 Tax=Frieseomelitta varia TaxID=561572 RepID=A0A833RY24_9HYME|nr:hypothetical protein E2986_11217 [Frieseomelitta varia]